MTSLTRIRVTLVAILVAAAGLLVAGLMTAPGAGADGTTTGTSTVATTATTPARTGGRPRWPYKTLQLGVMSPPGRAKADAKEAPYGFRYAYLSGGVNTGSSWQNWATGSGSYVSQYIAESEASHTVPVFSYYQIRQSNPGAGMSSEAVADLSNLDNRKTMLAYYQDLKVFFQRAAGATGPVVIQIEPDLWGYIQQRSLTNASAVPAAVASSGMPDLRGMPNTAAGFAQAVLQLRDNYAPRVIVAYHDSSWGTGYNIQLSHPTGTQVNQMAATSVAFYRSLHAKFNAVFTEMSDRDAGYAQMVNGDGTTWYWSPTDFAHLGQYVARLHSALHLPIAIWQIPVGNTEMAVMNNTPYHYQDNKVQSLLSGSKSANALVAQYAHDGVAALLFGSGQPTDTCACNNDNDTLKSKPKPIDGNTRKSFAASDDGGYLMHVAAAYYLRGARKVG